MSEGEQFNPQDWILALYRGILGREPDDAGWMRWTDAVKKGMPLEDITRAFVTSDEFRQVKDARMFVPPGHYYSPIPPLEEAQRAIEKIETETTPQSLPTIKISRPKIVGTWNLLEPFLASQPFPDLPTSGFRFHYDNPAYSWGDGSILHAMIRLHRPKRLIEIGNGWSSACILDTVERYLKNECELVFVDPFPELFHQLVGNLILDAQTLKSAVQDVPPSLFETLRANDILFIDSTHVLRTGSDVCFELFEILPRLAPGVLVHFHDMFWPFEYPRQWVVNENRSWNELYAIRAFLSSNNDWEVIMFNDYMAKLERKLILKTWPSFLRNSGGALWLRRR